MIGLAEDRIDRIDENPGAAGLTNRLIEEMDEGLGGVEKGTYNIIAGRPGMGKTSCASSLAIGFSIAGHMGVYFNAEMTAEQRSEEHTSELQSLMRISYAVFCLKQTTTTTPPHTKPNQTL